MSDTENKKNATERLEDLERTIMQIIQAIQPLEMVARDVQGLKEALKLINNKLDSVTKCINEGIQLTDENIGTKMTENNAKELETKVTNMVTQGVLAATDTAGPESFVVISESDENGKVVNPRMQFLVSALQHDEVRGKLNGAKVGANIPVGDKGGSITVLEAYNVVTPQAPEATAPEAPAAATEVPAATPDSSAALGASDAPQGTEAAAATASA
jgi:hypothetical protein